MQFGRHSAELADIILKVRLNGSLIRHLFNAATGEEKRMNITKGASLTVAFVLISGLFIYAARADICWETETTMTNVPHNSNGSSIQKYYLTETASRLELGDKKVLILNHNSMRLYALDPKEQKFSVLDLNSLPGFPAGLVAALVGLRVTQTGELKTISGYRCHGWNVHLAILNGECWFSDEVGGFGEFRILGERAAAAVERSPLFKRIDIMGTFNRVAGFPVYAVYHVLGGTVAIKLIKVEQKSLDPYLFVVPKGYSPGKVRIAGYNSAGPGPIHAMAVHEPDHLIRGLRSPANLSRSSLLWPRWVMPLRNRPVYQAVEHPA